MGGFGFCSSEWGIGGGGDGEGDSTYKTGSGGQHEQNGRNVQRLNKREGVTN